MPTTAPTTADERAALTDTLRRLLADHATEGDVRRTMEPPTRSDPALWQALADLGVPALLVVPEHGGAGLGPIELELVMEEAGAALACAPLVATAMATALLSRLDSEGDLIAMIAAGTMIATLAPGDWRTGEATVRTAGDRLTGTARYVLDAQSADAILVATDTGLHHVVRDAPGLVITPLPTFDRTRPLADVTFADTPARRLAGDTRAALAHALDIARVALAGEAAGIARRVLDLSTRYAQDRFQFGRAIGSFQAVKHMAADMLVESEGATSAARHAAHALTTDAPDRDEAIALAAFTTKDAAVHCAATAIQLHGGIAFTWDHPAHLYLRRARSNAQLLGDADQYRERFLSALTSVRPEPVEARPTPDAATGQANPALHAEVTNWLAHNWTGDVPAQTEQFGRDPRSAWLARVHEAGWSVPRWPVEWGGRALSDADARIVERAFAAAGAPGTGQDRTNLWANTALAFATDAFKARIVPQLLRGEVGMCLLYSEPGAGSDLAAIRTRADRDGEDYVIDGQKVWTSGAATADYGMLIARTDWDVPKHKGISFFFLPMKQPGVEVRPLRQITDEAHFNEVFLTGARVPAANMLGAPGQGWQVLQTALAYERSVMGDAARGPRKGGAKGERALVDLARDAGRLDDPVFRQRIAQVVGWRVVNRLNAARAKAEVAQGTSSSTMSIGKLAMSRILHAEAALRTQLLGAESLLEGPDHPQADDANFLTLNAYFTSIGGGTDQIQRNIIGERVLGLPREPEVDRTTPFRDVRSGTTHQA